MNEEVMVQSEVAPPTLSRAEELNAMGAKLFRDGNVEAARLHFLGALMLEPMSASAYQNLGASLRTMRHFAASEIIALRSLILTKGENPYVLSNYGVALLGVRKGKEAVKMFEKVVVALPEAPHAWHNLGLGYYMTGDVPAALEAFDRSLALGHTNNAASDRAMSLLSLGNLADGLEAYEVRWTLLKKSPLWELEIPEWQGESLYGRRILVHHEQGFGDSIMLVRFVRNLLEFGAEVHLAVPDKLVRLFAQSFPDVHVVDMNEVRESFYDYHTPILSMLRHLAFKDVAEISDAPYLVAEGESVVKLPHTPIKIGLCWASGNHSPELIDRRRLAPLVNFLPLLADLQVSLTSLQKGEDERDIQANGLEGIIFDPAARINDFADTAQLISQLDLVISVDSAVAHLAGALGKPCIMLSPHTRCWRWWGEVNGIGWPWYQNMVVFSQEADGSWTRAIKQAIAHVPMMLKKGM